MPLHPFPRFFEIRRNFYNPPRSLVKRKPLPEDGIDLPNPEANISERHLISASTVGVSAW
ncbi:MAG: hypothetical protein HY376_02925 [Candidatus Blackburnbacteria bacterium]|nr:hypothetical protein [Candidatus Blackburnbacteria bacterium]